MAGSRLAWFVGLLASAAVFAAVAGLTLYTLYQFRG